MKKVNIIAGLDPSFRGCGLVLINIETKTITLKEFSVDLGERTFPYICKASENMVSIFKENAKELYSENTWLGIEIPPTRGLFSVKLWALDAHLYNSLTQCKKFLFSTSYLRYIHGKANEKKDTINFINNIFKFFEDSGYTIIQTLTNAKGKPKKYTSNQCDAMLYATRIYCKYFLGEGLQDDVTPQIIEYNDRFIQNKEDFYREDV